MGVVSAAMAAISFVTDDQRILVMPCRPESFAAGKWSVLGGKVEAGETPEQAARREVAEESGLTVNQNRWAGHVLLYWAGEDHVTSLDLFVATAYQGELRGSEEGEPVWRSLSEVDLLPLVGYIRLILPLVLSPQAFVIGTIKVDRHGDPASYALHQHTIAGSTALMGP